MNALLYNMQLAIRIRSQSQPRRERFWVECMDFFQVFNFCFETLTLEKVDIRPANVLNDVFGVKMTHCDLTNKRVTDPERKNVFILSKRHLA